MAHVRPRVSLQNCTETFQEKAASLKNNVEALQTKTADTMGPKQTITNTAFGVGRGLACFRLSDSREREKKCVRNMSGDLRPLAIHTQLFSLSRLSERLAQARRGSVMMPFRSSRERGFSSE